MFVPKKIPYSIAAIFIVFFFLIFVSFKFSLWKANRNIIDAPSYYAYLPAVFIYHDLHLKYIDANPEAFEKKVWFIRAENGNKLIKHPPGIALLLSPFFLIAKFFASASDDGYSLFYQNICTAGVWFYLIIGLFFLRKFLLAFFSDIVVALILTSLILGTNLLWYATFEVFMPHAISFSLWSTSLFLFYNWLISDKFKFLLLFSIVLGLSILIRPLSVTFIFFFLLWLFLYKGKNNFFSFLWLHIKELLVASLIVFLIISIQLVYWKYITGNFINDVYADEHFVFSNPQIIPFLFSFRKGLMIYTPLMLIAFWGLFFIYKKRKIFFWPIFLLMFVTIFILSSWWAWSYGICWGMRPMIDYYPVLSIPLAASLSRFYSGKTITAYLFSILLLLIIILNLFQTWQYKKGLIHYDDMSKEAYFEGFFQTKPTKKWFDLLQPYNWKRRVAGLPQIAYSKEMFEKIGDTTPVYFRTADFYYLSSGEQTDFMLAAYSNVVSSDGLFYIQKLADNRYAIKSNNNKYLSFKKESHDIIVADQTVLGNNEQFLIEFEEANSNKIYIKAVNGNYLKVDQRLPLLLSNAKEKADATFFRFYLFEDYNKSIDSK